MVRTPDDQATQSGGAAKMQPQVNVNNANNSRLENGEKVGISLGFTNSNIPTMTQALGSEYTVNLAQAIKDSYKNQTVNSRFVPRVHVLDREVMQRLAYSTIIVSVKNNNVVNYFVILLEATGRAPLQARQVIAELSMAERIPGTEPSIYTADEAINKELIREVVAVLNNEYPNLTTRFCEGIVVPKQDIENPRLPLAVASIAYNACSIDAALNDGTAVELNIAEARAQVPNGVLRIETDMSRSPLTNVLGTPIRADWKATLTLTNKTTARTGLNAEQPKAEVVRVAGYIDAIADNAQIQLPNNTVANGIRLRPHIIVTSIDPNMMTTGFMLLGVVTAAIMTKREMYLAPLIPREGKGAGALNMLTNIEMDPSGVGGVLDLAGKKVTMDDAVGLLSQMFTLEPFLSVDVATFGPQAYFTGILSVACSPKASPERTNALNLLISTAHYLTAGNFPLDFNPNDIFLNTGVTIPMGNWNDRNGLRDIRDVDLAFVAENIGDVRVINEYNMSVLPKEVTMSDPYITKTKVLADRIPDAEITGKFTRVTFTGKFIQTLYQAATRAGLDPYYEPAVRLNEGTNYSMISNYFSGAGITDTNFGRQQSNGGTPWSTPYSNMGGYGRF